MSVDIRVLRPNKRSEEVRKAFFSVYKKNPCFYVRVPGRVNLIGEHIDYCGYGVCPMALEQDIFLGVSVENEDKKLKLYNLDRKFDDFECQLGSVEIILDGSAPKWHQYFLCGIKGILEVLPKDQMNNVKGLKVVVSGTIPQSAGLSSSSALVSAAALSAAHAFNMMLPKETLADICAQCEKYIGTQGGGMDQAIAFLATEGCAKLIEFEPLRSTDVKLPPGAVFVIAHSLTSLNKAATDDFNRRVVECRIAAQLIAKKKNLDWTQIKRLGDVQKSLSVNLSTMINLSKEVLHETPYSKEDVIRELETTSSLLNTLSLTPNTTHVEEFKLRQRAIHVFNEAQRVEKFYEACNNSSGGEDSLILLGQLMKDSHSSLKELYECSHPQLDRIVELAQGFTLGTRLTGAGWGGCTVSLVSSENVDKFVEFLKENFYRPLGVTDGFDSILFTTTPMAGACIYNIN